MLYYNMYYIIKIYNRGEGSEREEPVVMFEHYNGNCVGLGTDLC